MRKILKKAIASALSLSMLMTLMQVPAKAETVDVHLPEVEIEDSILESDVFYLASTTAKLNEGANERYLLRVARGGDAAEEAGVNIKISDMTAKYGKDYTVSVFGTGETVKNAAESKSLMEMMDGEEYTQSELKSDEEFYGIMEGDEELQKQTEEAMQGAVDYIEEKSGLKDSVSDYTADDVSDDYAEVLKLYSGVEAYPQKLTSSTDTMQQIQQMANVVTDAVIGADLVLNFEVGEKEKYLVIDVKDNNKSDGDRYFYIMLGAPFGSTTNSAASSCALTIADDEEQEEAKISFSEKKYTADGKNLQITVTRKGAINQMAVAHLTSEAGTAVAGRDFSPVDKEIVFPFGITKQTVDIPIRQEYLKSDADFTLKLEAVQNAKIAGGEAKVTIKPASKDASLMSKNDDSVELMAEKAYSVTDIVTGDGLTVSSPSKTGESQYFDGINGWRSGDHWDLMWDESRFWTDPKGTVGACWNLNNGKGYDYAGVQVDWDRTGSCANMVVGFATNLDWGWESTTSGDNVYSSKNDFGRQTKNFFTTMNNSKRVCFYNQSGCEDCDHLYIYGIKPIYRPFEINLLTGDSLQFLNENGTKSAWADATKLILSGANNQNNRYVVKYTKDGLNIVSMVQPDTTYATVTGAKIVDGSWTKSISLSGSDLSDTRSFKMDRNWIENNLSYINFKTNQVSEYCNSNTSTYGIKGVINIKPYFGYKDAKVVVKVPEGTNFGYFRISGQDKNIYSNTTYTYHRGDILKLDTVMRNEYKDMYEPAGYKISIKQNESDTYWVKRDVIVPYDDISGNRYLNEGKRLKYSYYEITPIFQRKGNAIAVRVKTSDLSKLDASYGFMKATVVNNVTVDNVEYREYVVNNNIKNGKVYTVGAKLASSAGNNAYITWKEAGSSKVYAGDMFYHRATGSKDDNVITISVETGAKANMYETLEGNIIKPVYNMRSHDTSAFKNSPAEGAIVSVGSEYATTDANGHFRTPPIRAMYGTNSAPRYLRYMISINGADDLRDVEIKSGKTEKQDIFMTAGSSATTSVDVTRQSVGFQNISTENGSIMDNISVYRDAEHQGEGTSVVVDYSKAEEIIELYAKLDSAPQYTKQVLNSTTGEITETAAIETVTGVTFVQYDPDSNTVKGVFKAKKLDDGSFMAQMSSMYLKAGYEIYIRVETDRAHGVSNKTVVYDEDGRIRESEGSTDGTTYADVFTGYVVVQRGSYDIPVDQTVALPMDMNFTTLPLVGTTGINFDFPFVTVGAMKTDTGYRMYLGFNPTSLYDKISDKHATSYMSDSGNYFGDLFSIKSPIKTFKNGLAQSYNTAFKGWENLGDSASDTMAAMGAPTWKMSFVFGVYFDFAYASLTDPQKGTTTSTFEFVGVGGFIAVNAGFKVAWYTLLPVVFIPAYFGIEISGSIMGFFGAAADTSKPKITYNDAKEATVDFNNSLEKFHANVKLSATVQVYVGVGLAGTIGLRGGGTFTAMGDWDSDPVYVKNEWGCALIFTAGVWIDLFLFSVPLQYTFPMIKFGSFEEYDKLAKDGVKLQSMDGSQVSEGATFGVREAFSDKKSEWLPDNGKIELMSAFTQTSQQTIVENGYEHPDAQLIKLSDGSVFMAFLDNDNARGEVDRTVLKYAVCNSGVWSDNYIVQNDTTGDFQPSICEIDGGKVMIAWVSTDPADRADDDKENTADYLRKLEVYTAVIDPSAKTVSEITQLTDDARYDYKPTCVYDDATGDRVVYYSKNFDGDASTEEMANPYGSSSLITYMLYSKADGKWLFDKYFDAEVASEEDRQTLIKNWGGQRFIQPRTAELGISVVPNIADFTAISYNGLSVYAYTVDVDSNADTVEDRELFLQFYDFETHKTYVPVRLTNDSPQVADAMPQFARTGSGESASTKLFWYRNSKQIAYMDITELVREGVNADGTIKEEYLKSKDEDVSAREVRKIDELYSYVSPISKNQHDAVGMADFKPVVDGDNIYIVWTQPLTKEDGEDSNGETKYKQCREVYATALVQSDAGTQITDAAAESEQITDKLGASWSSPYRLTYNELIADAPTAVIDSQGRLMVAYNTYEQVMNDPETLEASGKDLITFSNQKLMASYQEPCGAVEVTDIRISDITPLADEKVEIGIDVKNVGLTFADGYTVDIYEYKNGSKGNKIYTITSAKKLLPDNTDTYTIEWTAPDNVDGMSIYTVAHEADFTNTSVYESEKFEKHAVYELSEAYVYQDDSGAFRFHAGVKNIGNAPSADGDNIDVTFVGPYAMNLGYSIYECDFGSIAIENLDVYTETENDEEFIVTGQTEVDGELSIPSGVFEKFGYVDCYAEPVNKDGTALGYGEDVRIVASKPVEIKLNNAALPERIELKTGETLELNVTCQPASISETLSAAFAADDSNVALVSGNKLIANEAGETVLHGIVNPYSMELQDITVAVTGLQSTGSTISSKTDKVDVQTGKDSAKNGDVTVSKGNPSKGEKVTVTVTPDEGYTLSLITVTDKNGNKIKVTRNDDGTYSFVQPSENVTITPEFKEIDTENNGGSREWHFKDVPKTTWYYNAIKEAFDNGRMSGMGEESFEPETEITRGMFAYAIYNREGLPETKTKNKFSDVKDDSYYKNAIAWATDNGIVSGYDGKNYGPDDPITREQMVTILWRYAKFKDYDVSVSKDTNISDFNDSENISDWAADATLWTVGDGIIRGFEDVTIRPQNSASRAQLAVILNKIAGLF
ncbi:MAG: S-layer homology domain-containing protein [Clostridia bacterium]|nr:S-layer homology domain-containing protein [Clostridia bacterium]